jgi:hypothetical protein
MPVRYGPRRPVSTKLDAFKAILETRLAAYPALSAVRLLAEIRAAVVMLGSGCSPCTPAAFSFPTQHEVDHPWTAFRRGGWRMFEKLFVKTSDLVFHTIAPYSVERERFL